MAIFENQVGKALIARSRKRAKSNKKMPTPPRARNPNEIDRQYARELQKVADIFISVVKSNIVPHIQRIVAQAAINLPTNDRADSYSDEIYTVIGDAEVSFARLYTKSEAEILATKYASTTQKWNAKQIKESFLKVLGLDPLLNEPYLADLQTIFIKENVDLITSIPEQGFGQVRRLVTEAVSNGTLNKNFAADIEQKFGDDILQVTGNVKARAKLIARDQIAKYNGQLNMARQTNLGMTKYSWRTSEDERVRDSHRRNADKVFSWDNPPPTGHPGQDFQCRCTAEPIFSSSELLAGTELGQELDT